MGYTVQFPPPAYTFIYIAPAGGFIQLLNITTTPSFTTIGLSG